MNIVIRKLVFNDVEIHVLLWKDRACFLVSELSKALDSINKEDIPVFLRYGGNAVKGIDYDVVAGADARDLRSNLENSGIKKRFAHTMIIYFDGLRKYFNYRKTVESKDFVNYLEKSKISLDSDFVSPVGKIENTDAVVKVSPEPKPVEVVKAEPAANPPKKKAASNKKDSTAKADSSKNEYSEFLKHISFMEEFVDAFNKIKISPDKSVAFTKSMVKFLEDNGIESNKFLQEIKKWIDKSH